MTSLGRMCLLSIAALFDLSAMTSAKSAPYVVEGFTLGERIPSGSVSYRLYTCKPSEQFEDFKWCQRSEPRRTSVGAGVFSSTIMHGGDRTTIYLMANLAPVSLNRAAAQREIDRLSGELKELPTKVEWVPPRPGIPTSVIALWGKIELQELNEYEIEAVAAGRSPTRGVLVDSLGDLTRSAKAGLPVYRLVGGAGYLYAASFDANGRGHIHYVASDLSGPAIKKFEPALHEIVQEDQSSASDDYRLWPKIAEITRNLALDTSPEIANQVLDKVFDRYRIKKLRSHVWSILPLSAQGYLAHRFHHTDAAFGPKTRHPKIRISIQKLLTDKPTEPFSEFLFYTIGEFDNAVKANPNSVVSSVLNYAAGFAVLESLMQDLRKVVNVRSDREPVNGTLIALNQNAALYENKLLGGVVPTFATQAAIAKPYFEAVLRDQSSPLRDDAAYMLGWLSLHQGKFQEALEYTSQALTSTKNKQGEKKPDDDVKGEDDDYVEAAIRQMARILVRFPVGEQVTLIEQNPVLAEYRSLWWYVSARGAFRNLNYSLAIEIGEKALSALKVPLDRLPATTNPERILEALKKTDLDGSDYANVGEIVYLIEASREILDYEKYLKTVAADHPENVAQRARAIVLKYSLLRDDTEEATKHKDLRQATHLIERTLESVPKAAQYAKLREWLHYRNTRNLAQFNPKAVSRAVAAMEREFPKSQFMDDALVEQIYAEGARLQDIDAAERTFQKLIKNFPRGNAVDNAYTWMAISYACTGRSQDAHRTNQEIIRRFPATRHAIYVRERLSGRVLCDLSVFSFSDSHNARRRLRP